VLDLFLPDGAGPFPLVINIHGGGFRMGCKEMLDTALAHALLAQGVAVASINYRLSGEALFPAALQDAKAAVRFLRAQAKTYRLDPDHFIAFGQSAGGNLASMLGTSGGVAALDDPTLGHAEVSSRVQGVIDWFGPVDFLQLDAQARDQGCPADHGSADSPESRYLGQPIADVPEKARQANPITYIDATDPPFLLQKGDRDCLLPVAQLQLLHDALKQAGVPVRLDILAGAGHGDMGTQTPIFSSPENIARVVNFVRTTFGLPSRP
jgi:acetyl esterase/lipase